jgi:hypothetical protein
MSISRDNKSLSRLIGTRSARLVCLPYTPNSDYRPIPADEYGSLFWPDRLRKGYQLSTMAPSTSVLGHTTRCSSQPATTGSLAHRSLAATSPTAASSWPSRCSITSSPTSSSRPRASSMTPRCGSPWDKLGAERVMFSTEPVRGHSCREPLFDRARLSDQERQSLGHGATPLACSGPTRGFDYRPVVTIQQQ